MNSLAGLYHILKLLSPERADPERDVLVTGIVTGRFPFVRALAWIIIALLPYLTLRSQCYPYYACIALIAYAWLVAAASSRRDKRFYLAVALAILSSFSGMVVQPLLPVPAPLARVHWAEQALTKLSAQRKSIPWDKVQPVPVVINSEGHFAAGGYFSGPAMALGIDSNKFTTTEDTPTSAVPKLQVTPQDYVAIY